MFPPVTFAELRPVDQFHDRRLSFLSSTKLLWLITIVTSVSAPCTTWAGDGTDAFGEAALVIQDYCLDCHSEGNAEAHVNLEGLLAEPRYATQFRTWEKVIEMVRHRRMPPKQMLQPTDGEREQLVEAVDRRLDAFAANHAGDPGRVVMRRLTSAEYDYTIEDLTGLQLDLQSVLMGDAVGGEGFANVGEVQFVQGLTLERYLEAAKLVASRAVVGSGPLQFYEAPGKTGMELSAIRRIKSIYRRHGFRTAAGEGGEPFGLNVYPRALFVAWQYRHRHHLGLGDATLDRLARFEGISPRFVAHVWRVLNRHNARFPLNQIVAAWHELSPPTETDQPSEHSVRQDCRKLAEVVRRWQGRLARNVGNNEEALLLTHGSIRLEPKDTLQATINWRTGAERASVLLLVKSATNDADDQSFAVWRNPSIRMRRGGERRSVSLVSLLSPSDPQRKLFGEPKQLDGIGQMQIDAEDLVIAVNSSLELHFPVPDEISRARLSVDVELPAHLSPGPVLRCTVRDGSAERNTAADTGEVSTILGFSEGNSFERWKAGVIDFARSLPDVSHREPAPSDRDPIPAPFDNTYNSAERNEFHYSIKYHRHDCFLVKHILDDATRRRLQHAWNDLLSSFDYHDTYLAFVAQKAGRDLDDQTIGDLKSNWIASLPKTYRPIVQRLVDNYREIKAAETAAEAGHVEEALELAESAWRRPLSSAEKQTLRGFYKSMRQSQQLDHDRAIRALLTRILVSPQFLYRVERRGNQSGKMPLTQWELASRLSYFLWSSPPDAQLMRLAASGELNDTRELKRQAARMLRDAKTRRFATEFFGQWFGFYRFDEYDGIDTDRFPEFDETLRKAMYSEAILFFEYLVRKGRPADEILFADYAYWNHDLARHYGQSRPKLAKMTNKIQRVQDVSTLHRGGLLSLGVTHVTTSAPLRTSAVKRGDWILRRVLGTPVPPPPPDVGSIPADDELSDGKTIRDQLIAHRKAAACINCHSRMDPLGFAMENFDPIGRWRQQNRNGLPIDSSGTLNTGQHLDGFAGLQQYLKSQLPKFHRTLSAKLLGYALGRSQLLSDRELIEQMVTDLHHGASVPDLATRIVTSPQFRTKRGVADDAVSGHSGGGR